MYVYLCWFDEDWNIDETCANGFTFHKIEGVHRKWNVIVFRPLKTTIRLT